MLSEWVWASWYGGMTIAALALVCFLALVAFLILVMDDDIEAAVGAAVILITVLGIGALVGKVASMVATPEKPCQVLEETSK